MGANDNQRATVAEIEGLALRALALVSAPVERIGFRAACDRCASFVWVYDQIVDDPVVGPLMVVEALARLSAWQCYFMHHHPKVKQRAVFMDGWLRTWDDLERRGYQGE
jgi:hypothetical protein